eukprot:GFKZ01009049.1.p1 GENE.GFKZ01009049.1~~GFKZ01009049.1.p1  ORF type:complete len:244 (-),score=38.18 GFKZ01009049.1:973-1704(-)
MELPKPHELVVLSIESCQNLDAILTTHFRMNANYQIPFSNKYYSISVPIRTYDASQLLSTQLSPDFQTSLRHSPAISLILSSSQKLSITTATTLWSKLSPFCSDSAVVLLFIENSSLDESATYDLVDWGSNCNVEVITGLLCEEEHTDTVKRIENALECASWPQVSSGAVVVLPCENDQHPDNDDDNVEKAPATTVLSNPTRLRRALDDADVTRLVDELLLQDSDESDHDFDDSNSVKTDNST